MNDILIRPYCLRDFDEIAEIMFEAFGSKYGKLYKVKKEKLKAMMKEFVGTSDCQGNIVAVADDKVVGFLQLYSPKLLFKKKRIHWFEVGNKYGLKDTVRFFLTTFILRLAFVKNDECYVSMIGVSSKVRGKGIGTKLLTYAEELVVSKKVIKTYSLAVWKENRGAMRLYKKYGFEPVREMKSFLFQKILGYRCVVFMEKSLSE